MKSQIIATSRERGIFHQYSRKRTYVKKVKGIDLLTFKFTPGFKGRIAVDEHYYIECDKFGNFDWRQATVYASHALVGVDNVFIVSPPKTLVVNSE